MHTTYGAVKFHHEFSNKHKRADYVFGNFVLFFSDMFKMFQTPRIPEKSFLSFYFRNKLFIKTALH